MPQLSAVELFSPVRNKARMVCWQDSCLQQVRLVPHAAASAKCTQSQVRSGLQTAVDLEMEQNRKIGEDLQFEPRSLQCPHEALFSSRGACLCS